MPTSCKCQVIRVDGLEQQETELFDEFKAKYQGLWATTAHAINREVERQGYWTAQLKQKAFLLKQEWTGLDKFEESKGYSPQPFPVAFIKVPVEEAKTAWDRETVPERVAVPRPSWKMD